MSTKSSDKLEKFLQGYMGETIHTAFRKGSGHPSAHVVWKAIQAMPPEAWGDCVKWMCWALAYSINDQVVLKHREREGSQA